MFADVDADVYVLVDGDATYDAPSAHAMIARLIDERLDMVVAVRVDQEDAAYRLGHRAGNRLLTGFVAHVFGQSFTDMLSGYRVFTRRFVKSFPVLSGGFEIETELTVHALELGLPVAEVRDALLRAAGGLGLQAQHLARRRAHPAHRHQALPVGAAAAVLLEPRRCARHRIDRPGDPDLRHLFARRRGPAGPDRHSFDRSDDAGIPVDCRAGLVLDTVTRGRRELKLLAYLAQRAPAEERRRR